MYNDVLDAAATLQRLLQNPDLKSKIPDNGYAARRLDETVIEYGKRILNSVPISSPAHSDDDENSGSGIVTKGNGVQIYDPRSLLPKLNHRHVSFDSRPLSLPNAEQIKGHWEPDTFLTRQIVYGIIICNDYIASKGDIHEWLRKLPLPLNPNFGEKLTQRLRNEVKSDRRRGWLIRIPDVRSAYTINVACEQEIVSEHRLNWIRKKPLPT